MPLAARVGDMHNCPMVTPGLPPVPHVGGPILPPCQVNVLIGGVPAARVGDMATCVGPPDTIINGSPSVLIGNKPAARISDPTAHGGMIGQGCPTVLIGGPTAPAIPPRKPSLFDNLIAGVKSFVQKAFAVTLSVAAKKGEALCEMVVPEVGEGISPEVFEEVTGMTMKESVDRFNLQYDDSLTVEQVDRVFKDSEYAEELLSNDESVHRFYRDMLNQKIPDTAEQAEALGFKEVKWPANVYHNKGLGNLPFVGNKKFVGPYGYREAVYGSDGLLIDRIEDSEVMGTFNFHPGGISTYFAHDNSDIKPYQVWKERTGFGN